MWIVMHIAKGKGRANHIVTVLEKDGILVRVKPTYRNRPEEENDYQICVLKSEVGQARRVLIENGF